MHVLLRGNVGQRIRLVSGLILFAFALTHFLNHALGLFSVELMTQVQQWRTAVTRFPLARLADRSTLRMPPWELVQILLGLAIPFLLFPHMAATTLANDLFDVNDIYPY